MPTVSRSLAARSRGHRYAAADVSPGHLHKTLLDLDRWSFISTNRILKYRVLMRDRPEAIGMNVCIYGRLPFGGSPGLLLNSSVVDVMRMFMMSTTPKSTHRLIPVQLRSTFRDSIHNPQTFRPKISAQQAYEESESLKGRIRSSTPVSHQIGRAHV